MAEAEAPGPRRELVLASGNPGKLRELSEMLGTLGWAVRSQAEWTIVDAVEDGLTFVENAIIKARHAASQTGLPSLGDDSGLVVDALGGEPGIRSARYAGDQCDMDENIRKLLNSMRHVPAGKRQGHFYCALALFRYANDPAPIIATGSWHGTIAQCPKGSGGFGYDPVFWVGSHDCTAAQLEPPVKNRLSHRGQALASLLKQLEHEHFG